MTLNTHTGTSTTPWNNNAPIRINKSAWMWPKPFLADNLWLGIDTRTKMNAYLKCLHCGKFIKNVLACTKSQDCPKCGKRLFKV